ncbi:PRTRC system protein F [Cupriavidus laharis]|uniref:PRTRC system protein F n=1 Tax=Cupriavidus laharis TaxID=151654 RepID=UPI00209788AD|nr:PRTRC system protein F [Cupriavidus laharis]
MAYQEDVDFTDLVRVQFATGVLRAAHVVNPTGAGDAFAQAMFAWIGARMPKCQRLQFSFSLLDQSAVADQVSQFGWDEELDNPLYLGVDLPGDETYVIGMERAQALRAVHSSLLYTAMGIINAAAGKSLYLRTPDELLDMFARWHWEFDSTLTDDDDARSFLKERFGEDDSDIERYLPSVVRPELAPDDTLPKFCHTNSGSSHLRTLSQRMLRALSRSQRGWVGELCGALADLQLLVAQQGERSALEGSQWAEPAYSAAIIAFSDCDYVSELLDDHYDCINNSGDATLFQCFIPLASEPDAIRKQFRDLDGMLRIIGALDRVLTLISS